MEETSVEKIKELVKQFSEEGNKWHFHILTPECQLNEKGGYALILENTSDNEAFVCYSDEPYMDVGKKLVKLLHGQDVVKEKEQEESGKPSPQVAKILERARQLNNQGKSWHHHMLFPGCKFNQHPGKWVIIFEDKEAGEIIESVSGAEPKGDLKHIETLFYQQKKVE